MGPVEDFVNRQAVPGRCGRAYGELFPACILNIIEHNLQPLTKLRLLLPQQAVISDCVDRVFGSGTDPPVCGFKGEGISSERLGSGRKIWQRRELQPLLVVGCGFCSGGAPPVFDCVGGGA